MENIQKQENFLKKLLNIYKIFIKIKNQIRNKNVKKNFQILIKYLIKMNKNKIKIFK